MEWEDVNKQAEEVKEGENKPKEELGTSAAPPSKPKKKKGKKKGKKGKSARKSARTGREEKVDISPSNVI